MTQGEAQLVIAQDGTLTSRGCRICAIAPGEQVTLQTEGYTVIVYRKLENAPLAKVYKFRTVQP